MNSKSFVLLIIYLVASNVTIWAYERPYVINIYRDKYKGANKNWSACQDEQGTMYFGNDIGLLEFNGINWKLNRLPNDSYIKGVSAESHRRVFTGGFEDFGCWERDLSGNLIYTSLKHLLPEGTLDNETIWKVWYDDGKAYFQSFKRIFIYNGTEIKQVGLTNGILFLYKIHQEYWVQEFYGPLYRLKNNQLQKVEGSEFFNGKLARVILPYGTGQCLIGTSSGEVYLYNGKDFTIWNPALSQALHNKELNCGIQVSERGTYYWGTLLDGIYETDEEGQVIAHYSSQNSLQNNTILALYKDKLNNVWVGMDRGLAYIRYNKGLSYYNTFAQDMGAVYCAALWKNHLLLGTNQGVFYIPRKDLDSPNCFSSLKFLNGSQGQVWSFTEIDGHLYCGHNSNVVEIGENLQLSAPYSIGTGVFSAIKLPVEDRELLLVVSYNRPMIVDMKTHKTWAIENFPEAVVHAEVDHLNNIWLQTAGKGVYKCRLADSYHSFKYRFNYGNVKQKELPDKLTLSKIGGRILFTGGNQFWTYDENADRIIPEHRLNKCFASVGSVKGVKPINSEQGWVITDTSIYRFTYDGYLARILEAYNVAGDNLSLVNEDENIAVLNDSISLVCLDAGFILHNLHEKSFNPVQLIQPSIESVCVNTADGSTRYMETAVPAEIQAHYNNVTITFTESQAFSSNLSVQYRLEGMDESWSQPTKVNEVFYARLPQGKYTFHLRTVDGLGNQSEEAVYSFEISSPWYATPWAYLLYTFIIGAALYLTWLLVLRRYRNLHLQKIRAREAQYLRSMNEKLLSKIEEKDAELFTQTSFMIRKNELILNLKDIVDNFCEKNSQKSLLPLYQKMNALLANSMDPEDDWKMFVIKFEEKHKNFFKRLKSMYPQLTSNDLRLCACLKLGLDSKDIASLMNISVRAVENNRYRLRKKLDIQPSQHLNEFFIDID